VGASSNERSDISDLLLLTFIVAMDDLTSTTIATRFQCSDEQSDINSPLLIAFTIMMDSSVTSLRRYCSNGSQDVHCYRCVL
jgi:hypothetical protein